MTGQAWLIGTVLSVAAIGGTAVVWNAEDARNSVMEWGKGVVDRPIDVAPQDGLLDRRLVFDLDEIGVDTPEAVSGALTDHVEWWRDSMQTRVSLGKPYTNGTRAVWVNLTNETSKRRVGISNGAHPVECADPAKNRQCYHAGISRPGGELHLLLTLEHDGKTVGLHADGLMLLDGDSVFRSFGGPLSDLDGTKLHTALYKVAQATGQGKGVVESADLRRWAIQGHATAKLNIKRTMRPGPQPSWQGKPGKYVARPDWAKPTFVDLWRAENADLVGDSLVPAKASKKTAHR
jgi:hypothetical protein